MDKKPLNKSLIVAIMFALLIPLAGAQTDDQIGVRTENPGLPVAPWLNTNTGNSDMNNPEACSFCDTTILTPATPGTNWPSQCVGGQCDPETIREEWQKFRDTLPKYHGFCDHKHPPECPDGKCNEPDKKPTTTPTETVLPTVSFGTAQQDVELSFAQTTPDWLGIISLINEAKVNLTCPNESRVEVWNPALANMHGYTLWQRMPDEWSNTDGIWEQIGEVDGSSEHIVITTPLLLNATAVRLMTPGMKPIDTTPDFNQTCYGPDESFARKFDGLDHWCKARASIGKQNTGCIAG
ncbi:MAG: hypothetical protein MUD10_01110 [Candidatus Pacebacteria bacterium]|jgi:hypothetical protein|nr:hypothetical protein [Candidatus Paceibacterota bacterium]